MTHRRRIDRIRYEGHVILDGESAAENSLVKLAEVEAGIDVKVLKKNRSKLECWANDT